MKPWVRPWMVWLVGYPCCIIDHLRIAHEWAVHDVQAFLSEHQNKGKEAD